MEILFYEGVSFTVLKTILKIFFRRELVIECHTNLTYVCLKVFCYVSRKMAGEGSEKTWDQCRVKLKNLKSQWRYVKDRIPGIETADLDDEDVVRQLSQECQTRGGELTIIPHIFLLFFYKKN